MSDRIHISFVVDTLANATAGTERQLLEMVERLDRKCFEPLLITLHGSPWLADARLSCAREDLGWRGFLSPSAPAAVRRLRHLVAAREIDVLHTFLEESVFVTWLATLGLRRRVRLVASRRDIGLGAEEPWYHRCFRGVRPLVAERFDAIVANGPCVARYVAKVDRAAPERIRVIPNGVLLDDTPRVPPTPMAADPKALWIVEVANLKPVKRVDLLLEAMAQVVAIEPGCRAIVIGEGAERGALEAQRDALGLGDRVLFPGAVADVRAWLQHAAIGVSTSDREGLSNAILEAMSCSLPIVASAVGDTVVLVDDGNGRLIPPGDSAALAAALLELVRNPQLRRECGARSRQRVDASYSWAETMSAYERLYVELTSDRSRLVGKAPSQRASSGV